MLTGLVKLTIIALVAAASSVPAVVVELTPGIVAVAVLTAMFLVTPSEPVSLCPGGARSALPTVLEIVPPWNADLHGREDDQFFRAPHR